MTMVAWMYIWFVNSLVPILHKEEGLVSQSQILGLDPEAWWPMKLLSGIYWKQEQIL